MTTATWITLIFVAGIAIGAIGYGLCRLKAWIDRNTKP